MAAIPVAKVASLLVRTLAKPIATKLKKEAGLHPLLSSTSQFIGQRIHSISSRINVTTAGFKFLGVKPLPKEEALSKGVNFISEVFIFSVAVSVVVVENYRSDYSAKIKKEKESKELKLKEDILESRFSNIEESIQEIEESLPTSSAWHLQKVRKLKADMKEAEAKLRKDSDEQREREIESERANTEKKKRKVLPKTPRVNRLEKAKKDLTEKKNVEDVNSKTVENAVGTSTSFISQQQHTSMSLADMDAQNFVVSATPDIDNSDGRNNNTGSSGDSS